MALSTEAAAVNTKVDELLTVWKAYLDTLTPGDRIFLIGIADDITHADAVTAPTFSALGSRKRVETWRGGYFYRMGPGSILDDLFFKVSDAAGALT